MLKTLLSQWAPSVGPAPTGGGRRPGARSGESLGGTLAGGAGARWLVDADSGRPRPTHKQQQTTVVRKVRKSTGEKCQKEPFLFLPVFRKSIMPGTGSSYRLPELGN